MTTPFSSRKFRSLLPAIAAVVLLALLAWGGWSLLKPKDTTLRLSGLVQAKEVKVASRLGGRVKQVMVAEGDTVKLGQPVIRLDAIDLQAQITEAHSALKVAQARLSLLRDGADPNDLRQASAQVQQAQQQLAQLRHGARPEELAQANSQLQDAQSRLTTAKAALDNAQELLDAGVISQQKYQGIQADVVSAQSAYQSAKAKAALVRKGARPEEVRIAMAQVTAAQAQRQKLARGGKPEDFRIAQAGVDEAQSALNALLAKREDLDIKAPASGTVSVLNADPGELVPPNRPIIAIIDYNKLWVDVYVPESKLQWIRLGQTVDITSGVFPKALFKGRVAFINPRSEFIPQGADSSANGNNEEPAFRVKVELGARDTTGKVQILPGMTVFLTFSPDAPSS